MAGADAGGDSDAPPGTPLPRSLCRTLHFQHFNTVWRCVTDLFDGYARPAMVMEERGEHNGHRQAQTVARTGANTRDLLAELAVRAEYSRRRDTVLPAGSGAGAQRTSSAGFRFQAVRVCRCFLASVPAARARLVQRLQEVRDHPFASDVAASFATNQQGDVFITSADPEPGDSAAAAPRIELCWGGCGGRQAASEPDQHGEGALVAMVGGGTGRA